MCHLFTFRRSRDRFGAPGDLESETAHLLRSSLHNEAHFTMSAKLGETVKRKRQTINSSVLLITNRFTIYARHLSEAKAVLIKELISLTELRSRSGFTTSLRFGLTFKFSLV